MKHKMTSKTTRFFSFLFVSLLALGGATATMAAEYLYDPDLAKAVLSQAGVSDAAQTQVVDYLDARDATQGVLSATFSDTETHLYTMELESRERTYQALANALGKSRALRLEAMLVHAAPAWEAPHLPNPVPLPEPTLVDGLDALSGERHRTYSLFVELGADSATLDSMKTFDAGISGLAALAEVTGQSSLFWQYFDGTISGTNFLTSLAAGAPAHLWEGSMAEFEPVLDAFVAEYDSFTVSFSRSWGSDAQVYFDYLAQVATSQVDVSQDVSERHLESIRTGNDLERDLTVDLIQMGTGTSFSNLFSYFDKRRAAYAAVLADAGSEAATDDLFGQFEYVFEQWEIDLAQQAAAIRNDPKLHQMDAFDDAMGDVLAPVINLGYSQFNPYDGMTLEEAVVELINQAATAQALADAAEENQDDEDWMKKTKEILRKIKKIKVVIPILKIALKKELDKETMKEVCKWIKIACVILRAACDILEILCEDKNEQPVDKWIQADVVTTPSWIPGFHGRMATAMQA